MTPIRKVVAARRQALEFHFIQKGTDRRDGLVPAPMFGDQEYDATMAEFHQALDDLPHQRAFHRASVGNTLCCPIAKQGECRHPLHGKPFQHFP